MIRLGVFQFSYVPSFLLYLLKIEEFLGIKITASRELVFRLRLAAPNDTMCLFRACIFRARIRSCCWLVSGSQGRFYLFQQFCNIYHQVIVNAHLYIIIKTILIAQLFFFQIIDVHCFGKWIYNPVFTDSCRTVFE